MSRRQERGASLLLLTVDEVASPTTTTGTAGAAVDIGDATEISSFLNVITAAVGGTPTLDVVIQSSDDGGQTWYDFIRFAQVTTSAKFARFQVNGQTAAAATEIEPSGTDLDHDGGDTPLTVNTNQDGPFGNLIRGLYWITAGSTSGYKFQLHVVSK